MAASRSGFNRQTTIVVLMEEPVRIAAIAEDLYAIKSGCIAKGHALRLGSRGRLSQRRPDCILQNERPQTRGNRGQNGHNDGFGCDWSRSRRADVAAAQAGRGAAAAARRGPGDGVALARGYGG